MCLSKYSNLELLEEVARKVCSSQVHENMSERELAACINTFYQESDVATNNEKRKIEQGGSDNKKLKCFDEVSSILSVLELLPNEVYEKILKNLDSEDKKNLRSTSVGLYHKTNLMAPMFKNWSFEADQGTQPDFVLKDNKNFCVSVLDDNSAVDPVTNLFNGYSHRITSIKMNVIRGDLLYYLNNGPDKFPNLTTLDLESVFIKNYAFLVLAPKLENLRLADKVTWVGFELDISSVDEDSKRFTKLKTLSLQNIIIDLNKILSKCCNTLESLDLNYNRVYLPLVNLDEELSCLNNLSITVRYNDSANPVRNLLSKCSRSLKSLKFFDYSKCFDLSSLLEETLKITTLELESKSVDGLALFLNKCPLVQNLTLIGFDGFREEENNLVLKDLRKLTILNCFSKCTSSVLRQASKSSVKSLHLEGLNEAVEFPVIPELDTLFIESHIGRAEIGKLFPKNTKTTSTRFEGFLTVYRRVYGIS